MKEIRLTQNQVSLVDDCDFERLNQVKWFAKKGKHTFYASRHLPTINGKRPFVYMHHEVLGKPSKGLEVDHKNGNGTDNRKENLRFVTRRQNQQNQQNIKKSSRYPGVYWHKYQKRWRAIITIKRKQNHIGYFTNEKDAFEAYKQAVHDLGEEMIGKI